MNARRSEYLNPGVAIGLAITVVALLAPNPLLTAINGIAFAAIWWGMLSNPLRCVIACLVSAQWLQASTKLWLANAWGISLAKPSVNQLDSMTYLSVGEQTVPAIALALGAVVMVSLGARLTLPSLRLSHADFLRFAPDRLLLVYFPLFLISQASGPHVGAAFAQLIDAMGSLRFVPIALLTGIWLHSRRGGVALAAVFLVEIVVGFFGYFSGWKHVLILGVITLVAIVGVQWARIAPLLLTGLFAMIALGTVWTVIKPEYRSALSLGAREQVILLSPAEQSAVLYQQISNVRAEDLSSGFLHLLSRISYVDYLGDVLDNVPSRIEHQGGTLWGQALQQFLMPRFLFPNKPPLPSDSERTMRFTGQTLASDAQGTSISIGYVGESYIDFGVAGALIIPLLIGILYGVAVHALMKLARVYDRVIVFAASMPLLWSAQQFEISNVKMVGIAWSWLACALLVFGVWPRIEPFLLARGSRGDATLTGKHAERRVSRS